MQKVLAQADTLSASPLSTCILIKGPPGSGKGVVAEYIWAKSATKDSDHWVEDNCATWTPDLALAKLTGHKRGAFTGAVESAPGLIGGAATGVCFLDETGDMPASVQPFLLKILNDRRYHRVGEPQTPRDVMCRFGLVHKAGKE